METRCSLTHISPSQLSLAVVPGSVRSGAHTWALPFQTAAAASHGVPCFWPRCFSLAAFGVQLPDPRSTGVKHILAASEQFLQKKLMSMWNDLNHLRVFCEIETFVEWCGAHHLILDVLVLGLRYSGAGRSMFFLGCFSKHVQDKIHWTTNKTNKNSQHNISDINMNPPSPSPPLH